MAETLEVFGQAPEGGDVHLVEISGGGLTARVMTWGAVIQDLRLAGHRPPLVLGFDRFTDYPAHSRYFGAIAGRYANRIANGRFTLDGETFEVERNQAGRHHLHGGTAGTGKRLWRIEDHGADFVRLAVDLPDGEMGYPGNLAVGCTYTLTRPGVLAVELTAKTDRATLCNLAQHSYFNLEDGGATDVLDHQVDIDAQSYIPVDGDSIPTGEIASVAGSPFDFREPRPIRFEVGGEAIGYDHNFCLAPARRNIQRVAGVRAPHSGVEMQVWTTEPGIQFYTGQKLDTPVPGLTGRPYGPFAGLCFEPQVWPDSPNHANFPSAILRPGQTYRQETQYRFSMRA
ncbi:MAG TPA: aldose epimerase family protein [Devosiaceae bacterium]